MTLTPPLPRLAWIAAALFLVFVGCRPQPPSLDSTPVPSPALTASPSPLPPSPTPLPRTSPLAATPTPVPSSTPTALPVRAGQTLSFANRPAMPDLDLFDVTRRLRPDVNAAPLPPPARQAVGETMTFWAFDLNTTTPFRVNAVLRESTAHADIYVQDTLYVSDPEVEAAARVYEETVYPRVTAAFGPLARAEVLTVLHLNLPAVAGYFDSGQEYPPGISPYSNQRPMLFLNAAIQLGSNAYASLVAHELQHAVHWEADSTEEVWVNEGLSVLASGLIQPEGDLVRLFLQRPLTQLTAWPSGGGSSAPNYGAAGLLMEFMSLRYPGKDRTLRDFVAEPLDGLDGIDAYLAKQGYSVRWPELFAEWAAANYLDGRASEDPYPARNVAANPSRILVEPGTSRVESTQFAAHYTSLRLPAGSYRVSFEGSPSTPLIPTAEEPPFWWSGSEDAVDATLTRAFDLRGVRSATLDLRLWYDTEEDWDFLYLAISKDGGRSWEILRGPSSTDESPVGQAVGPGYTGHSGGPAGPVWIRERVDLSAYAGQQVLVRLEYVTDGATNLDGVALAGAAIPEIGYLWDGTGDGGWEPNGFFFSDGTVQQEFAVRLLLVRGDGSSETVAVPLDTALQGEATVHGLGTTYREAALMVFPMAPATRQPATFSYRVEKAS